MMILHDEAYYESRKPLEDLGPWRNFLRFIWDRERKAFLDRTAIDWCRVLVFYFFFFGILFSIFVLQLYITLIYISGLGRPVLEGPSEQIWSRSAYVKDMTFETSFLPYDYPGLGVIPNLKRRARYPSIFLDKARSDVKPADYIQSISKFFDNYNPINATYANCDGGKAQKEKHLPCNFQISSLDSCAAPPFGYEEPYSPCVYLKINKRYDWVPIPFNQSSELPINMPDPIKTAIRMSTKAQIWLSCYGISESDKLNIGKMEYHPEGFPVEFFPFARQKHYVSPLVAVKFSNLTRNKLINVGCNIWARNIHRKQSYQPAIQFQLLVN